MRGITKKSLSCSIVVGVLVALARPCWAVEPDEIWAQPTSLLISVAGLLCGVGALVFRSRLEARRLKTKHELIEEAAESLADGQEPWSLALGKDPQFNRHAEALNEIGSRMAKAERKMRSHKASLQTLGRKVEHYRTASAKLASPTQLAELREVIPAVFASTFQVRFVQLWLLHRYSEREAPEPLGDEPGPASKTEAGEILSEIGIEIAARATRSAEDEGIASRLKLMPQGVLQAATDQTVIHCPQLSEAEFFEPVAEGLAAEGFRCFVALPLVFRGHIVGVIEAYNDLAFDSFDIQLMDFFGQRAALLMTAAYNAEESTRANENMEMKNIELEMTNRKLERSNTKLSQADRIKGEFLANTSHELRTPLNSIMGFAKLIVSDTAVADTEAKEYAQTIFDSGERLLGLINKVLDLAKLEAGKMRIELAPIDIRTLLDASRSLLHIQAEERGNELLIETPDAPLPLLRADHSRLYQVLVNIIGNAIKFTEGGRISVKVTPEEAPGFMLIEVVDTGAGIDPSDQAKLFHSFVQADGSATRKFGGTGLGLTISKKLIELQGGAIRLTSPGRNQGTTLSLEIPLWSEGLDDAPSDLSANESPVNPESDSERRTVVVIEDYLEFQLYLKEILEDRGWRVLTARTAAEGIELIQNYHPTAIVLDMHLPCADEDATIRSGYDIIRVLGQTAETTSIPIVVITAMHEEACNALLAQTVLMPVELFAKPLEEDIFFESLDRVCAAA